MPTADWADRDALRFAQVLSRDGFHDEIEALAERTIGRSFGRAPRRKQLAFVAGLRVLYSDAYGVESLIRVS